MSLIEQQLEQLHETRALLAKFQADQRRLVEDATPPEVKQRIADIEQEFAPAISAANFEISRMEGEIKAAVAVRGETIRGTCLQAVFSKGRQSWDNVALDEYAETHPEILKFRKIGSPSVSIRIL